VTNPNLGRILVVDDQRNMRATTALLLRSAGYNVVESTSAEKALAVLATREVDLLLTDLKMEPMDGFTLLQKSLQLSPETQVIVMTAYASIEGAVEAMRLGAHDYLTKPFTENELLLRVRRALEHGKLISTVNLFAGEFNSRHGLSALVGRSRPMQDLTSRLMRVASTDAAVLIQGESGTGKELVARALHAHSLRHTHPFVPVNCAAIPDTLLESELFGHAKGAFTGAFRTRRGLFEEAHGGTLFIDEVTETSPAFQSRLLRVLQEGEVRRIGESTVLKVDVRTVAATNRDIEKEVAEKRFREDLYYRLKVVVLHVPALRERLEDVPLLATHFLERANAKSQKRKHLSAQAVKHLESYSYPGNVRQLQNLIEQAAALSERDELRPEDFPFSEGAGLSQDEGPTQRTFPVPSTSEPSREPGAVTGTLAEAIFEAERQAILQALAKHPDDLNLVAKELGVSPTTLWRKMRRLALKDTGDLAKTPTRSSH
jgi:two-component system, NtrC family, response regulator HydG